jgi:uncharacterized protein
VNNVDPFRRARALSLATFRADGTSVATAMWFYVDGVHLFTTTVPTTAKVRRLLANPNVELAVCTQTGKITGPIYLGTARVMDVSETEHVLKQKQKRYPVHRAMMLVPSLKDQIGIEITPGVQRDNAL